MDELVVIDFETTGLSTEYCRVIEIGAAIIKGKKITKTFSTLCQPGVRVPPFITELTGITNQMLKNKPSPEDIMPDLHHFIGERPILAHNASFDSQFLIAEMERVDLYVDNPMICTMLLARRIIQEAPNHKLNTLKKFINYKEQNDHHDHRALDDVKVTVALWLYIRNQVELITNCKHLDIGLYNRITRMPKNKVQSELSVLADI